MLKRAAVLGKPVGHSLSPVLHNAGYAAAGLFDWAPYEAIEVDEPALAGFVEGLGPEWAGLSLTMPLKEVALTVATSVSDIATAVGAANTLARRDGGWFADNTDVPGMVEALRTHGGVEKPSSIAVLGGGGTARAALGAASLLGTRKVVLFARRPEAAAELNPVAEALGLSLSLQTWPGLARCTMHDVVISTVPKGVLDTAPLPWRPSTVVFDVVYDPWPTPFAAGAQDAGCRIVSGLDLLHAQALGQFELFTGVKAPAAEMRAALDAAVATR
ncbi:shikimate dehydrogenase [Catelliglobosispora koreensis]|uniref:shikimate dehydrogenase n=1 Tax=Catelliglobosispora koreensis TaxID=129052 RepID=UPI0003814851|nr:shikimate dehydrogenase [Catelliglobosispora koreensis]